LIRLPFLIIVRERMRPRIAVDPRGPIRNTKMISRRTFISAGLLGAAALAAARWLRSPAGPPDTWAHDADALDILSAVVPVLLAGALPDDAAARRTAVATTVQGVMTAIAGLSPSAQEELRQLFALLSLPPARMAIARVTVPWSEADEAQVRACLDRFRGSSLTLLRSAYGALHQLTFAAWYAGPAAWPRIGYPGPPDLGA
jgi:hypothetical protein